MRTFLWYIICILHRMFTTQVKSSSTKYSTSFTPLPSGNHNQSSRCLCCCLCLWVSVLFPTYSEIISLLAFTDWLIFYLVSSQGTSMFGKWQYFIFFFFLLLLFNYSCLHFLYIPPHHTSQTHLPAPPPPSPLVLSMCPL